MADAWGGAFGSAWGSAFGSGDTPPAPAAVRQVGGSPSRSKKRWWQIGDKVYHGTQSQISDVLEAFISKQEGQAVEAPALKSKPAPKREQKPKPETVAKVQVPEIKYEGFDWRPMYVQYVLQREMEMAMALEAAIRRRYEQEEDDIETILLLH